MSEVKWIKIVADIFDNKKIRIIEAMPDGDTIIVVWFKILMLAGSTNDYGYIYLTKEIPYTDQMLATVFNRPLTTVQLALKTFEQFGMIEIIDNIIHISNWEKYQNIEGLDKIREQTKLRVAKHRERKQLEMQSNVCSYCGNKATGYDHIIAIARGGEDVDSNKTPCCSECNRIKNNEPLIDFLNNNRDRINDSLVMGNSKLTKYVTLCNDTNRYTVTLRNVTDRYNVTHGNATDIDIDIDKDIDIEKDINKKNKKEKYKKEKIFLSEYDFSESEIVQSAFNEFLAMRIAMKKPMTERAILQLKKKLETMSTDEYIQADILDYAVFKTWQDIYPLPKDYVSIRERPVQKSISNRYADYQ